MLGGVAAQGSQAVGSFALQILAARLLGLDGLGRFAALYAVIILATAVCSGFVGDSLTVLDRSQRGVRAGIEAWLAIIATSVGLVCSFGAWASGFVSGPTALAFGAATSMFVIEDTLRRLLMATLRFWQIVAVDIAGLLAALAVIATASVADDVTLAHFMVALLVGQAVAAIVAVGMLPSSERYLERLRHAALSPVAAYGAWRAVQQAVRPALLAAVRVVCLLVVSAEAVGRLEAARIYMAPGTLAVAGVSSFLFASYASRRASPLTELVRLADRSVRALLVAVSAFGLAAIAAMPWLAPLLTGAEYDLSVVAVVGWAAYAAALAAVTPYASLASVRRRQAAVLGLRLADSTICLLLVTALVVFGASVQWVPVALGLGSVLGGLAIRQLVLMRDVAREEQEQELAIASS